MYTDSSSEYHVGSGFLITDTDSTGTTQRYLLTNAHCARYVAETRVGGIGFGSKYTYSWASYKSIVAIFDGEETQYNVEIVAYGAYDDSKLTAENDQADIAILRIKGTQPSNEAHPSLQIATTDVRRGDPVALIGNPEGIGEKTALLQALYRNPISLSPLGARVRSS